MHTRKSTPGVVPLHPPGGHPRPTFQATEPPRQFPKVVEHLFLARMKWRMKRDEKVPFKMKRSQSERGKEEEKVTRVRRFYLR